MAMAVKIVNGNVTNKWLMLCLPLELEFGDIELKLLMPVKLINKPFDSMLMIFMS